MWFANKGAASSFKDFSIGYHKAIKKILGLSFRESNHYACQEANLFTFEHLINKIQIMNAIRLLTNPCEFVRKINSFLSVTSVFYNEIYDLIKSKYQLESLIDNDKMAIMSRIGFVQNHEEQLRGPRL